MDIYLACTVRGDRGGLASARALADLLEQHGHTVLTRHLLADDVEAAESTLTESPVGSMSCCSILGFRSALWTALTNSAFTRASTGAGMPAGANIPNQELASNPGNVSATAGTCGRIGERFRPDTAMARILPDWTCGSVGRMETNMNETCPLKRSTVAGEAPL